MNDPSKKGLDTEDGPFIRVECYAGYCADTEPRRLHIGPREIAVTETIDRWLHPIYRYFKLRGDRRWHLPVALRRHQRQLGDDPARLRMPRRHPLVLHLNHNDWSRRRAPGGGKPACVNSRVTSRHLGIG
jgi:hypothetical protein